MPADQSDVAQLAGGTWGSVVVLQVTPIGKYLNLVNASAGNHTFTLNGKTVSGKAAAVPLLVGSGGASGVPTDWLQTVTIDSADSSAGWFYSDNPIVGPRPAGGPSGAGIAQEKASGGSNITTTSTAYVSTGIGVGPITSKVLALIIAQLFVSTSGADCQLAVYRNATGVPSAGTSVGGDTAVSAEILEATAIVSSSIGNAGIVAADPSPTGSPAYYYIAFRTASAVDAVTILAPGTYNTVVSAVYI